MTVWRRKWLMIVPVIVAGIAGVLIAQALSPVYEAKATIVVRMQERLSEPLARIIGRSPVEQQLTRLQEKVKSRGFLVELVRALDLAEDEAIQAWAATAHGADPALTVEELAEGKAVASLQQRVSVRRTPSDAFHVVVRDSDPERAMLLAQHITNAFVASSNREQLEEIRAVHDFSIEQLVLYRQKLDDAESRLQVFKETQVGARGLDNPVTALNVNRVDVLISQASVEESRAAQDLAAARTSLMLAAGSHYDALVNRQATVLTGHFDFLMQLERQVASVLVRTAGDGPELTSLYVGIADRRTQVRTASRGVASEVVAGAGPALLSAFAEYKLAELEHRMISERKASLSGFMWQYTRGQASAAGEELELTRLEQEVESNRALYDAFLQQTAAGQITEALEAARAGGRFEVIEPPVRPTEPVAPDKMMIVILSVFGGFVVGLGLILATEQSDSSFRDIDDIQRALGLKVLATVPDADVFADIAAREKRMRKGRERNGDASSIIIPHMVRETPVSFEFRRLARKLGKNEAGEIPKTILVTSSNRGEGKTTVATCLAITLAKHYNRRTILVDCDLRKPRIHRLLGVTQTPGLTEALERGNLLGTDIKSTDLHNLSVLPCGSYREHPTWLLESFPQSRIMAELIANFDHVILDTAPNLPVPDAILLGGEVDGVLLVLKAGTTPREVAKRGVQLQLEEEENVLGLIVNNIDRVLPYYYDYRYYGYETQDEEKAKE